jgi:2-polyprenyl-6-methoxyphenol hydroxylase-like FAD-dependent oxidoreductase
MIIGGGIGGLAAARALTDAGWRVTLSERETGLSGAGTALGMWPSAMSALDRLGAGTAVREHSVGQATARFVRPGGGEIGRIEVPDAVRLVARPVLLEALRTAAAQADLRFGEPVGDVAEHRARYDMVVAADGVFSRVRTRLFGAAFAARYTGSTAWRGVVDREVSPDLIETWGSGAKFGVTPMTGGRTNWYATAVAEAGGTGDADLPAIFGGWSDPVATVLAHRRDVLRHDLYAVPRLPSYVDGNVALVGDAAHAMPPDLGRGACEALLDAVALADAVAGTTDIRAGLAAYDRRRRRPTQRLATTAAAASRLTRWTRALGLRDALVKVATLIPPPA